ncbi:perlucin-like [Argopecten irradians]|uniref:perlucin-like n=1 Tax=Argopecten irradians TaxID=31199 RepID=UPI00371B2E60
MLLLVKPYAFIELLKSLLPVILTCFIGLVDTEPDVCLSHNQDKMATCFLLVVLMCSGLNLVLASCPVGWVEYKEEGECLLFVTNTSMGWHEAEHVCSSYQSYLVTDDNQEKHAFIKIFLNIFKTWHLAHFWIGASDFIIEDQWRWLETGVSIGSTSFWAPGQPNGDTDQDCVAAMVNASNTLVWKDYGCHAKYHFICEKKAAEEQAIIG